jgi:hypothetical protein
MAVSDQKPPLVHGFAPGLPVEHIAEPSHSQLIITPPRLGGSNKDVLVVDIPDPG